MTRILTVLILALVVEAVGVVFLSRGLKTIGEVDRVSLSEVIRIVGRGATNRDILVGVALEAMFFGALLYLLSQKDVSLIWPLTSLGFVITALAAHFVLGEHVSAVRWAGVLLIVMGAALVSYSDSAKPAVPAPAGSASASASGPGL